MYLKALTIQGFKTFAQRTQFAFEPGITAIVGPNGSGKSNLADAIRWVLGEQSLRSLRSRRTEDVLFAGSPGRPPAGMADVTLTFDNSGRWLESPFEEVSVGRRAYRTGENEYYLNRDRVRLRDVADLLARISLGSDGFAIVGQGTVDAALSLRPEDRRGLIEQAAAVSHLHARIEDALQRLDLATTNLARVSDLIAELTPRLRVLERQARQAREREVWQSEFRRILVRWYAHLWFGPRQRCLDAERELRALRVELDDLSARMQSSAEILNQRRADRTRAEDATVKTREVVRSREAELAALDQAATFDAARRADLLRQRDEFKAMLERQRRELEAERASIEARDGDRISLKREIEGIEKELANLERQSAEWQARQDGVETRVREIQGQASQAEARVAMASARLQSARDRLSQALCTIAEHGQRISSWETELAQRQQRIDACRLASDEARDAAEKILDNRRLAAERHDAAQSETRRLAAELAELDRDVHGLRARRDALLQVESNGSAYFSGVRAVLQAANGHGPVHLAGVVGVVARLLLVGADIEIAVETALGGHLQDIVVDRWVDAEAAIAHLKRSGAGRATFLPLDTLRLGRQPDPPDDPGLLGVASRLVDIDPRYRIVTDYLLGLTLIATDLGAARRVIRYCAPSWQIVTLEGEVTRSSGVVTGGAPGQSRGTLARHRELRQRNADLEKREAERDRLAASLSKARLAYDGMTAEMEDLTRVARQAEETARQAAARLSEEQRQGDRLLHGLTLRREELRRAEDQAAAAERAVRDAQREEEEARRDANRAKEALAAAHAERACLEQDLGAGVASLADARSRRDTLRERIRSIELTLAETETRIRRSEIAARDYEARLARLTSALDELAVAEASRVSDRARLAGLQARAREELTAAQRRAHEAAVGETASHEESQRLQSRCQDVSERLRQAERRYDVALTETEGLRQQILLEIGPIDEDAASRGELRLNMEDGSILAATIEPLTDPDRVFSRLDSLRHRLRNVGANPEAIAEFEQARERHTFLSDQSADLQRTIATLQEAIDETRSTMKLRFDVTFTAVAASFSRRFVELFGGGNARLVLSDEASGIDVIAQPPGKRAESLSMLSGGERALTAAALLFALIEVSPPPFCVLDEVDAAMDEGNVDRFCQALRELSEHTQFVVITHNRRTMEVASTIYGLAVQNRSESRVLSLDLPGS